MSKGEKESGSCWSWRGLDAIRTASATSSLRRCRFCFSFFIESLPFNTPPPPAAMGFVGGDEAIEATGSSEARAAGDSTEDRDVRPFWTPLAPVPVLVAVLAVECCSSDDELVIDDSDEVDECWRAGETACGGEGWVVASAVEGGEMAARETYFCSGGDRLAAAAAATWAGVAFCAAAINLEEGRIAGEVVVEEDAEVEATGCSGIGIALVLALAVGCRFFELDRDVGALSIRTALQNHVTIVVSYVVVCRLRLMMTGQGRKCPR
ncbi:BZ3500_MvSof-1268-A1-R1_Chr1-1g01058 [Microbotryum saponariae]|uniref:BZ3500_MvSof-1268-A1-R1_Chr1-1g01058 protein n=1 Tax=Microbotryum saponariae TaxID=289078 RepID=A0A2X0MGM3_9BASI|nr:BZ3500_MvSof-1268-A1-R1_Chr1-1g01058 [Microbotryum saponariae]SCZ93320.1 BZ3501_MvSof-1269-A2-R1_Chr1-1g00655 [Microbotryum saponariae]